jgi:uncharacterized membrane protein YbhN (UPF0104 family)
MGPTPYCTTRILFLKKSPGCKPQEDRSAANITKHPGIQWICWEHFLLVAGGARHNGVRHGGPMSHPPRKLTWSGTALRLAGSAIVLALLFHFLHAGQLWAMMRRLPRLLWLAALAGYLLVHLLGVTKWRLMVNLAGAGLSFAQAARCYFAGLFGTLFLPSIIGGDVVRAGLALRLGRNKAGVLLGSLLDRIVDLVGLTLVAAAGAALLPGTLDPRSRRVFAGVAMGLLVGAAIALLLIAAIPARRFPYRMRRHLTRVRQAWRSITVRPLAVLGALGLAVTAQTCFIVLTVVVAKPCGLWVPFRAWLFAWPLAKLSAMLPVSQGGIGIREAALAGLLAPFGAPAVMVVAVGLVWETIIIGGGLIAGLVSLGLGQSAAWRAAQLPSAPKLERR